MHEAENKSQYELNPFTRHTQVVQSSEMAQRGLDALLAPAARTIRFPAARAVGKLFIRACHWAWWDQDCFWASWQAFGDAKGDICVPAKKSLRLDTDPVAAKDLSFLRLLKPDDLQALYLWNTPVTDAQLVNIRHLSGLKLLSLSGTHVTDQGLIHLQPLQKLRVLGLSSTSITDSGTTNFQHLPELVDVYLRNTQVSDAGLHFLQRTTNIKNMALSGTQVSDDGVVHLLKLKQLQQLDLTGSRITEQGLEKLRYRMPECRVILRK